MLRSARLVIACVAVVGLTSLLACSGGSSDNGGATVHVRGTAMGYSMDSVTIDVGETVTWIWDVSGHSVTSSDMVGGIPGCTPNGMFDSGVLNSGAQFTFTFPAAGTYAYYCSAGTDCSVGFESAVVLVQ